MAYQQKRSSVVGKVPTVADFGSDTGQLIINTADGKIYMLVGGIVKAFSNDDDLPATAPIGSVIMMASDHNFPPPGYLLMNGAPVTATYPELRAHGIAAGWERNAAGDPLTPDMGGYIARGWRPGQLVDAGRVFGSVQLDAFQDHEHPVLTTGGTVENTMNVTGLYGGGGTSSNGDIPSNPRYTRTNPRVSPSALVGNAGLIVSNRTANETRPINRTVTYWVKAYPAKVDTGSVDLANLTRDIQGVATSVSDLENRTQIELDAKGGFWPTYTQYGAADRPTDTVFQNTTGRDMFVNVRGSASGSSSNLEVGTSPTTLKRVSFVDGASTWMNFSAVVPNGCFYRVSGSLKSGYTWSEQR